jgi:hypothetical protein
VTVTKYHPGKKDNIMPQFMDGETFRDMAQKRLIETEGPFDLRDPNGMDNYLKAMHRAILRTLKRDAFRKIMKEPIGKGWASRRDIKGWPIVTEAIIALYIELLPFYPPTKRKYFFKRKGKMDTYHGELINDILDILKGEFPVYLKDLEKQDIIARIEYYTKKKQI